MKLWNIFRHSWYHSFKLDVLSLALLFFAGLNAWENKTSSVATDIISLMLICFLWSLCFSRFKYIYIYMNLVHSYIRNSITSSVTIDIIPLNPMYYHWLYRFFVGLNAWENKTISVATDGFCRFRYIWALGIVVFGNGITPSIRIDMLYLKSILHNSIAFFTFVTKVIFLHFYEVCFFVL